MLDKVDTITVLHRRVKKCIEVDGGHLEQGL